MSSEGREEVLCANGHLSEYDQYSKDNYTNTAGMADWDNRNDTTAWKCPICGAFAAWWNIVDETNGTETEDHDVYGFREDGMPAVAIGYFPGEVDWEENVKEPEQTETCSHCNQTRIARRWTYNIPEGVGHKVHHG